MLAVVILSVGYLIGRQLLQLMILVSRYSGSDGDSIPEPTVGACDPGTFVMT
jgi:hypothetical protein